ncbi:MAG: FecR family protein [Planctomycetota bacterium]
MDNSPRQEPDRIALSASDAEAAHRLCSRLLDDVLTESEAIRLGELVGQSSLARAIYLRHVALEQALVADAGTHKVSEVELLRGHVTADSMRESPAAMPEGVSKTPGLRARVAQRRFAVALSVAATLLLALASSPWFGDGSGQEQRASTDQFAAGLRVVYASLDGSRGLQSEDLVPFDAPLPVGNGHVELLYDHGTRLTLIGPAEFVPEPHGGVLRRGRLLASVTEAGHGFTVKTPNGKVVDLGTEFGVAVDDFGLSEVGVFQGKVEAYPDRTDNEPMKFELGEGKGLQWGGKSVVPVAADLRRYARSLNEWQSTPLADSGRVCIVNDFREGGFNSAAWQTLGPVRLGDGVLELGSPSDFGSRPYLVSREQFDPADGTLTITCEVAFAGDGPKSLFVVTRAQSDKGVSHAPWDDMLASGARCGINALAGHVETGVKLESNREVNSHAQRDLSPATADAVYRLVVRDDGVNLSCSASTLDGMSVARTVTRSLFRGRRNHVAIEGPRGGVARLHNIKITQDSRPARANDYGDVVSLVGRNGIGDATDELLDRLAPRDGVLLLEDRFSNATLDAERWTTLGDVATRDGSAWLGLINPERHIDTWRKRPYLLLREPLEPGQGTLTILGKIEFSDNYLAGYGASFAVVTRAVDRHAAGDGWEASIVDRAVRANFWPASVNRGHTLEIHQKTGAGPVSLLAKKGARIDPASRVYVFRVTDDGHEVSLTMVDPRQPQDRMTIDAVAAHDKTLGLIGFESCWGSPIGIDTIRVYRSSQPSPRQAVVGPESEADTHE